MLWLVDCRETAGFCKVHSDTIIQKWGANFIEVRFAEGCVHVEAHGRA